SLFVKRAADVTEREVAFFLRRRAELIAEYNRHVEPLLEFIAARGVPLNLTRTGRIVAILPLDGLAWTESVNDLVLAMDQDLKARYPNGEIEVRVSGKATANARA